MVLNIQSERQGSNMTLYQILSLFGIPSLIVSVVIYIINEIRFKASEQKNIHEGLVAILHNMVYTQGKAYIDVGEISLEDMKDYEYLYKAYHNLGGNGTGTEIYERVKNLKII